MTLAEDTGQAPTYIRLRGNFKDPGAAVTPGTPEALPAASASQPPDRLALARWLVSPDNPLTARVAVNRMWQELFGRGLVSTSEDFGSQGEKPTHPELLDWLATEFMRTRLEPESDLPADSDFLDVPAEVRGKSRSGESRSRKHPAGAAVAAPAARGADPGLCASGRRSATRHSRRAECASAAARRSHRPGL